MQPVARRALPAQRARRGLGPRGADARRSRSASASSPTIDERKVARARGAGRDRCGPRSRRSSRRARPSSRCRVLLYFARHFYLEEIDQRWIEHLKSMEALREGIGLRGYGQKDPKQEYKKEGFVIFGEMMSIIGRNVCEKLFHMQLQRGKGPPHGVSCRGGSAQRARAVDAGAVRREPRKPASGRRRGAGARRRANGGGSADGEATPSRCAGTSPRSGATIPARAEAVRNTRNATAPSSRRSRAVGALARAASRSPVARRTSGPPAARSRRRRPCRGRR